MQPEELERRALADAARLILGDQRRRQAADVTFALVAWRAHLRPGHLVLRLLEEYRAALLGEREALTEDELAPLRDLTD